MTSPADSPAIGGGGAGRLVGSRDSAQANGEAIPSIDRDDTKSKVNEFFF